MKIKTSTYLRELAEAERRGYERGMREAEERMWDSRRLEERDEEAKKFRARILRTLEEHEESSLSSAERQELKSLYQWKNMMESANVSRLLTALWPNNDSVN